MILTEWVVVHVHLETVESVSALTEAGAGFFILAGVHNVVPEGHGKAPVWLHQRENFHCHIGLMQCCGARQYQLSATHGRTRAYLDSVTVAPLLLEDDTLHYHSSCTSKETRVQSPLVNGSVLNKLIKRSNIV